MASTFALDLVDYWLFVIDIARRDDIPRKRRPGVVQCHLPIINRVNLAHYVRVDRDRLAEVRPAMFVKGGRW